MPRAAAPAPVDGMRRHAKKARASMTISHDRFKLMSKRAGLPRVSKDVEAFVTKLIKEEIATVVRGSAFVADGNRRRAVRDHDVCAYLRRSGMPMYGTTKVKKSHRSHTALMRKSAAEADTDGAGPAE